MKNSMFFSLTCVLVVLLSGCFDPGIYVEREKQAPVDIETERKPTHDWWPEGSCIIASPEKSSPYHLVTNSITKNTGLNMIGAKEYWETNFPDIQPNIPIDPNNVLSEGTILRSLHLGVGHIVVISFSSSVDPGLFGLPLGFITSLSETQEITHSLYLIDLAKPNEGDLIQAVIEYGENKTIYLIPPVAVETHTRPGDEEYKTIALNIEKQIKDVNGKNLSGVVLLEMVPCLQEKEQLRKE